MRARSVLAALLAIAGLTGCGSGSADPVVVRIGELSIGRSLVRHWEEVIGLGREFTSSLERAHGTTRERALDLVISAKWLLGEAGEDGLAVSDATIEHRLQQRIDSVPDGESEFEREIAWTGQTVADVKLEIKAESAARMLRAMVARGVPPVTQASIADYYRRNRAQFRIADLRLTDLIEGIHGTRASAAALGRRLGPGRRFAKLALHEWVARPRTAEAAQRANGRLVQRIFTAGPGELAGPTRFNGAWVLAVVRKVVPGRIRPLAAVGEEIAMRLASQRRRAALLAFVEAYRSRWIAKTDCSPGFVVQKCSQYHGPMAAEADPLAGY